MKQIIYLHYIANNGLVKTVRLCYMNSYPDTKSMCIVDNNLSRSQLVEDTKQLQMEIN